MGRGVKRTSCVRHDCKWTAERRQARVNFPKGTELGAAAFLPFQASRSIVKWDAKKLIKS